MANLASTCCGSPIVDNHESFICPECGEHCGYFDTDDPPYQFEGGTQVVDADGILRDAPPVKKRNKFAPAIGDIVFVLIVLAMMTAAVVLTIREGNARLEQYSTVMGGPR